MTSGTRGRILQFRLWGNERSVHDVTPRIGGTNLLSDASSFHTAIFDALCACLNLSASDGIKLIHEAYAEPENVPRPPRNRNVIYWTVLQDPSSDPVSTEWNEGTVFAVLNRNERTVPAVPSLHPLSPSWTSSPPSRLTSSAPS